MSGIEFNCGSYSSGITTTIFPEPQRSFIVETVINSSNFTVDAGKVSGIPHTYVSGGQVAPLQMELIMSILENSTT